MTGSCLFHAAQAIEKRKAEFKSKASFAAFKLDFKKLQGVQSTVIFHHAASLFIALWDPKEPKVAQSTLIEDDDSLSIKQKTKTLEIALITKALKKTNGNRTHAAKVLEISHRALLYKIKESNCAQI